MVKSTRKRLLKNRRKTSGKGIKGRKTRRCKNKSRYIGGNHDDEMVIYIQNELKIKYNQDNSVYTDIFKTLKVFGYKFVKVSRGERSFVNAKNLENNEEITIFDLGTTYTEKEFDENFKNKLQEPPHSYYNR